MGFILTRERCGRIMAESLHRQDQEPAMYHAIVRRKLRRAFEDINAGRFDGIVDQFAPVHRHVMAGRHALAGERRSRASTARWYERLQRVLPGLRFELRSIVVGGMPWRTVAAVAWDDRFPLPDGSIGTNSGVHEFELRWGRVHSLVIHCDTDRLQRYCERIAQGGVAEARAAPITDPA
jgi:ketosteroid isomerase-like protein